MLTLREPLAVGMSPWQTSDMPEFIEADVFYVNHTFDPPVSGIMEAARRNGRQISTKIGAMIPAEYIVCWKQSHVDSLQSKA